MVVDGNKLGRTLGYPTANIVVRDDLKLVPANGIYVAEAELVFRESPGREGASSLTVDHSPTTQHSRFKGMMSIGVRPTVDGKNRTIEMNIFDFEQDIYGSTLKIYAHKYLRPEAKFNTLDELKHQIDKDKEASLAYFADRIVNGQ
jgi:riboflavin kinase/FMN adenylyltransferase